MNEWNGIEFNTEHLKASEVYRRILEKTTIPPIHFKPEWDVRIIPPFGGAMMRFTVDYNDKHISVYCDFFENLGLFGGEPYWEMYPRHYECDGKQYVDVMRFPLNDTENLVKEIDAELSGEDTK